MNECPIRFRARLDHYPPYLYEPYPSTVRRSPRQPLLGAARAVVVGAHRSGVRLGCRASRGRRPDPQRRAGGEAIGQRIIVTGRVLDEHGRPVPNTLVEVWQANAAGRYLHTTTSGPAPLDPNFLGIGRCLTDADGDYRFLTVRPGAYPVEEPSQRVAARRTSTSRCSATRSSRGWSRRCTSPAIRCFDLDPIFSGVPDRSGPRAADRAATITTSTSRSRRSATAWTSCCAAADETPFEKRAECQSPRQTAVADRRPVLRGRPDAAPSQSQHVLRDATARTASAFASRDGCSTATAPDRGRAGRDLAGQRARPVSTTRSTPAPRRSIRRSSASAAAHRRPTGPFGSTPSNPVRSRAANGAAQAPHISVTVFARGMLVHAFTRMYFGDDALDADPALALVDSARRRTLVAERTTNGSLVVYRWDIRLQGERETVFFDA